MINSQPSEGESRLKSFEYEQRSAIVQCHVLNDRLWILSKNRVFDYYAHIGFEPTVSVKFNSATPPRGFWSNRSGTRFIIETTDLSIFYFQINMNDFFRIGALNNGPVATVYFDDDQKDQFCTGQIFIVVQGGGVIALSISTKCTKHKENVVTTLHDFITFPTLFKNYKIIDMAIFRVLERKSDKKLDTEIKEDADNLLEYIETKLQRNETIENNFFVKEINDCILAANKCVDENYKLINQFKIDLKNSLNNNDKFLDFINVFTKEISKFNRDIISNYADNPNEMFKEYGAKKGAVSIEIWAKCISNMDKIYNTELINSHMLYKTIVLYYRNAKKLLIAQSKKKSKNKISQTDQQSSKTALEEIKNNIKIIKESLGIFFSKPEWIKRPTRQTVSITYLETVVNARLEFITTIKGKADTVFQDISNYYKEHNLAFPDMTTLNKVEEEFSANTSSDYLTLQLFNAGNADIKLARDTIQLKASRLIVYAKKLKDFVLFAKNLIDEKGKDLKSEKEITVNGIVHNYLVFLAEDRIICVCSEKSPTAILGELMKIYLNKRSRKKIMGRYEFMFSFNDNHNSHNSNKDSNNSNSNGSNNNANSNDDINNSTNNNNAGINKIKNSNSDNNLLKEHKDKNKSKKKHNKGSSEKVHKHKHNKNPKDDYNNLHDGGSNDAISSSNYFTVDPNSRLVYRHPKFYPTLKLPSFYVVRRDKSKNRDVLVSLKFNHDTNLFAIEDYTGFAFEDDMRLVFYQTTPSGLLAVQCGSGSNSRGVAFEISSMIMSDDAVRSNEVGLTLWREEIADYSLLPLKAACFCPKTGVLLYNSLTMKLIDRRNVDRESFNRLLMENDAVTLRKTRRYLAMDRHQHHRAFFLLLICSMNQLMKAENKNTKVKEAKKSISKLLLNSPCSKMELLLFLLNERELNKGISFIVGEEKNDGMLLKRFRRFKVKFLTDYMKTINPRLSRQRIVLFLVILDLKYQEYAICTHSTGVSSEYYRDRISKFVKKYGPILSSAVDPALYIAKCYPLLDSTSLVSKYIGENSSNKGNDIMRLTEIALSKANKYLVTIDPTDFDDAKRALLELCEYTNSESKEIDQLMRFLMQFAIEYDSSDNSSRFKSIFDDLLSTEKNYILPDIPQTVLSLFITMKYKGIDSTPVINYLREFYHRKPDAENDLLFSMFVSLQNQKEIESIQCRYDITLAIYRSIKHRVQAAHLLTKHNMPAVAIDVVLDSDSPVSAIKLASSMNDENTNLYLIRSASRRDAKDFRLICNYVVDSKQHSYSNQKLDQVLKYIPDDKLNDLKGLQANVIGALEKIDNESNAELQKIHNIQERIKAVTSDQQPESFTVKSPLDVCDLCHSNLMKQDYFVFPCGHSFHLTCYKEKFQKDEKDKNYMIENFLNHDYFTITNRKLCLICGLGAIELIDTPPHACMTADEALPFYNRPYLITDEIFDESEYEEYENDD